GDLCDALRLVRRRCSVKAKRRRQPQLIVILSDINMPGMDGLTLLGEIKQRWPELPVIMVAAYGDDERRCRADEYGAAELFTKPVDFEMLKDRLRQLPGAGSGTPRL